MGWEASTGGKGGYETTSSIVNQAATELGLIALSPDFNDTNNPYQSTDAAIILLCRLLTTAGRELVDTFDWTNLRREYAFTTVLGQSQYPLPAGFRDMVDQTGWNRTSRLPMGGPLSAQEWQYLSSRMTGVVFTVLFRPMENQLVLYPSINTPGGQAIALEYKSTYWVAPNPALMLNGPSAAFTRDAVSADGGFDMSAQYVGFDSLLIMQLLKVKWLRAKGFNSSYAEDDYGRTLERCKGNDSASPVLNVTGAAQLDPLLGPQNFPITGYGT